MGVEDRAYRDFVVQRGYSRSQACITVTRHDLADIPDKPLPDGFRFHDATAADAAKLADVHNHSFTSKWDAESYRPVFEAPHMEREIVVVAPDGRFAAFVKSGMTTSTARCSLSRWARTAISAVKGWPAP